MKIAIHSPFIESAETASGLSMIVAGKKLGYDVAMFNYVKDIEEFRPDFVLVCHHYLPKLTRFPTYGYLFDSLNRYDNTTSQTAIMSWDGYLTPSEKVKQYIEDICHSMGKISSKKIFYNTSHCSFDENNNSFRTNTNILINPNLIYFGNNWDSRHLKLLTLLSREKYFKLYGPEKAWKPLKKISYSGSVPYTPNAVIDTYRENGVGLALQSNYFVYDDIISNRIFEINSAGAVVIAGHMPFVEQYYGDSLLYINQFDQPHEVYKQIKNHMMWIKNNPEAALEKALQAQIIFQEQLSIEKLLPNVIEYHKESLISSGYICNAAGSELPEIAVIIRTGTRPLELLSKALDSILEQIYPNVIPILIVHHKKEGLHELLELYKAKFDNRFKIIEAPNAIRSTALWTGLNYVKNNDFDYFCILDDDDEFFPNHLMSLYNTLDKKRLMNHNALLSTNIVICQDIEADNEYLAIKDIRRIHHIPLDSTIKGIINKLSTNSFLCNSNLLTEDILLDPKMYTAEDTYLFYCLLQKTLPYCGFRATALIHNHLHGQSNFSTHPQRRHDLLKLKTRFIGKTFANGEIVSLDCFTDSLEYPDYVQAAHIPYGIVTGVSYLFKKFVRKQIKKCLKFLKPVIVSFITKPLRLAVWILTRIYHLK